MQRRYGPKASGDSKHDRAFVASRLVFRLPRKLKDRLKAIADLGERSQSWVMGQALNGLFADMEKDLIRPHELFADDPGIGSACFTWTGPAVHRSRLLGLVRTHRINAAVTQRVALVRYLHKRAPLMRGERKLVDDMREPEPVLPP